MATSTSRSPNLGDIIMEHANPTPLRSLTIPAGEPLRQRFRILIHEGPPAMDAIWQAYRDSARC